jgi:hypothetical protein
VELSDHPVPVAFLNVYAGDAIVPFEACIGLYIVILPGNRDIPVVPFTENPRLPLVESRYMPLFVADANEYMGVVFEPSIPLIFPDTVRFEDTVTTVVVMLSLDTPAVTNLS